MRHARHRRLERVDGLDPGTRQMSLDAIVAPEEAVRSERDAHQPVVTGRFSFAPTGPAPGASEPVLRVHRARPVALRYAPRWGPPRARLASERRRGPRRTAHPLERQQAGRETAPDRCRRRRSPSPASGIAADSETQPGMRCTPLADVFGGEGAR